ncbi:MAG: DNA methyltransferase [Chloroflexota bacterium]
MSEIFTPQKFVENWRNTELSERASYQAHFMEVCRLIGYETPTGTGEDKFGNRFVFERSLKKQQGGQGFADVFLEGHFAIEYKAPNKYKDLREAYDQLLQYREQLNNPPLLIVTDIQNWEIHTNFPNTEKRVYAFSNEEIATRSVVQDYLRDIFTDPAKLHPNRNTEQVTADAAKGFQIIADNMRQWQADPERIAHFLTKLVFCLFAEDVSLLPSGPRGETGIFSEIIEQNRQDPKQFVETTEYLFKAMADGTKIPFVNIPIPYFNGSLFDDVSVEELSFDALSALETASRLNWESVEPAIFGTLFERSLDPEKRAQLGAHYTSREDILLIVNPVLMRPLEREWEGIQAEAEKIRPKYDEALATSNKRNQTTYANQLKKLREEMLTQLRDITVLDPACGSGNFLYVALRRLMDMEKEVIKHPLFSGLLEPFPEVHPRQMYGIEINPIAHALASIVVWIGYLQWRRTNGYLTTPKEPILEDIHENILNMDAILAYDENKNLIQKRPIWQNTDVIVGNPPFLGAYKMRGELGGDYLDTLHTAYSGEISGSADLVTYFFNQALQKVKNNETKRVGLISTNSIRGGVNRDVLDDIKSDGDIFMAWSDRNWILDGAAVRVSMIAFDDGSETEKTLDGEPVNVINPDLTSSVDITVAEKLSANSNLAFGGTKKGGAFNITEQLAVEMLNSSNASLRPNRDVIKPWVNGSILVGKNVKTTWIIDFGHDVSEDEAKLYEAPYAYVKENIYPIRKDNNMESGAKYWWLHSVTAKNMRSAIEGFKRYIATPRVSKYRLFVWINSPTIADDGTYVIARDDDYFFGVLHSKLHEVWSLRMGTWLGKGNDPRYTPTTTFETFPFPWSPSHEDTSHPAYVAISQAAQQLHEE